MLGAGVLVAYFLRQGLVVLHVQSAAPVKGVT